MANYVPGGGPAPINTSPYNAGSRSPRPPNNGNPRGANNMPRQQPEYLPPVPFDPTRRQQPAGGGYSTRPPMPRKDPYNPNEVQPNGQVNKPGNGYSGARNPMLFGPQQPPMPQKPGGNDWSNPNTGNNVLFGVPMPQGGQGAAGRDPNSYEDFMRTRQENGLTQPISREEWEASRVPQDMLWGGSESAIGRGGLGGGGRNGSGNFQQMLQQLMERFRSQGVGGRNFNVGFQPQGQQQPQPQQYPPRGDGNYYAQQSPDRGRYVPPMMNRDGQGWQGQGGYNYNLPNAFGSYPGYGQGDPNSQYFGYGYNGMYGGG